MRNMSFMLTTKQVRDGTKNVTRRIGWAFLKSNDKVMACEKCQGLKKGEKIVKIRPIKIISVKRELLSDISKYDDKETAREGFPHLNAQEFIDMFCKEMRCSPLHIVNRIEFEYL